MNNNALQAKRGWIKPKKLTTKLLTDYFNPKFFNPEGLDRHNCRSIILNNCRNVFVDDTQGAKYNRFILRKKTINYHRKTKKMMAEIEKNMALLHIGNSYFKEFDGAEFILNSRWHKHGFGHNHWELDSEMFERGYGYIYYRVVDEKFEPGIRECSTCLMFEYFNERWEVLDVDDYADYYDPSYGLDGDDETELEVHDRLIGKRLRRYLMEQK
jgi:hypothetical protein